MAQRRMISQKVIDTDAFLNMPTSTRLLYYDLNIRADDDGFVDAPKKIARMTGASDDDIRILITKKFIIPFDSGICVIRHWKIHNYIQKDRYNETIYLDEKATLKTAKTGEYISLDTERIHNVSIEQDVSVESTVEQPKSVDIISENDVLYTECVQNGYTGKVRLGKVRLGKVSKDISSPCDEPPKSPNKKVSKKQIEKEFEKIWNGYPKKIGKAKALATYEKARHNGVEYQCVLDAVIAYSNLVSDWDNKFIKHGSTWFNQKGWEDDYREVKSSLKQQEENKSNEISERYGF